MRNAPRYMLLAKYSITITEPGGSHQNHLASKRWHPDMFNVYAVRTIARHELNGLR